MSKKFKAGDEVFVDNGPFGWEPGIVLQAHEDGTYCVTHVLAGMGEAIGTKTDDDLRPRDGTPFVTVH